jgi:uncharacterized protein
MKRIHMVILILGIACTVFGVFAYLHTQAGNAQKLPVAYVRVGKAPFAVEVADTFMSRGHGLSGHAPLGKNDGMLFVFPSPSAGAFWMQGMLYPLDFVWIAGGYVVGVTENAPPMSTSGYKLYYPPQPVDYVLEVNAGAVRYFGIKEGDAVY